MGYSGGQDVLCKNNIFCSYKNPTLYLPALPINTVSMFVIIFVTDFKLTGFECEILNLNYNYEMYIIYEAN